FSPPRESSKVEQLRPAWSRARSHSPQPRNPPTPPVAAPAVWLPERPPAPPCQLRTSPAGPGCCVSKWPNGAWNSSRAATSRLQIATPPRQSNFAETSRFARYFIDHIISRPSNHIHHGPKDGRRAMDGAVLPSSLFVGHVSMPVRWVQMPRLQE